MSLQGYLIYAMSNQVKPVFEWMKRSFMGDNWDIIPLRVWKRKQIFSHRANQSGCFVFAMFKSSSLGNVSLLCIIRVRVCSLLTSNFTFNIGCLSHSSLSLPHTHTRTDFTNYATSCSSAVLESQPNDSRTLMRLLADHSVLCQYHKCA